MRSHLIDDIQIHMVYGMMITKFSFLQKRGKKILRLLEARLHPKLCRIFSGILKNE